MGLDPEAPPTTWAELKDAAKKLSIDGKRWGFAIPADGMFLESLVFQCGGTSLNAEGTDIGFNNEAGIEAVDFLKGMMSDGLMKTPAGEDYTSFDSCRNDFIGGTVGIIYSSSGDINYLTESTEFELGVAMLPANTEQGVGSGGANIVMFDGFSDEDVYKRQLFVCSLSSVWGTYSTGTPSGSVRKISSCMAGLTVFNSSARIAFSTTMCSSTSLSTGM